LRKIGTYAGARVIGNFLSNRAGASTTLKGRSAGELAAKRGTQRIRAGILFVGAILTILVPVAQFALLDALWCSPVPTLWAVELVVWAGHCGAILLISPVCAVLVAITSPPSGDTEGVVAAELTRVARREVAVLFVRSVGTLGPVVALLILLDAFLPVLASELRQLARHPLAAFLVRLVPAVVVPVALLLLRDEQPVLPPVHLALVVLVVLLPIVAVLLVAFVMAVNHLVTPIVGLYAVC
jgi:hypothetical protein